MSISPPARVVAESPFDKTNADIVLRSCDNVHFYLHKLILGLASPVFETMFTLPQPTEEVFASTLETPVVDVAEDSKTLDKLFRTCYPVVHPTWDDISEVMDTFVAAQKYDMDHASTILKSRLHELTHQHPLQAWAIACKKDLEDLAQLAAMVLRTDHARQPMVIFEDFIEEMEQVSAAAYYRLLQFRAGKDLRFCVPSGPPLSCDIQIQDPRITHDDADIIVQCSDGFELFLHCIVLRLMSPKLAELVAHARQQAVRLHGLPLVKIEEPGFIFVQIMNICYPSAKEEPQVNDYNLAYLMLKAALKYNLVRAVAFIKRIWMQFVEAYPLQVYLVAANLGWWNDARDAAVLFAIARCDERSAYDAVYTPEMEDIPARHYHKLYKLTTFIQPAICKSIGHSPYRHRDEERQMKLRMAKHIAEQASLRLEIPLS